MAAPSDPKKSQPAAGSVANTSATPGNAGNDTPVSNSEVSAAAPEIKQTVITSDDTAGRTPRHWRVSGFRGGYKGVNFDDDGFSDRPVPDSVAEEFHVQYPNSEGASVQTHSFEPTPTGKCAECGRNKEHSLHS